MAQNYSAEQVQQILVKAMEQNQEAGFTRSQLEDMAQDLGISPEALAQAEQSYDSLPVPAQAASRNLAAHSALRPQRRQQLITYAVVNTFLIGLNISLSGTITWAIYPLLGWGMGLLLPDQASSSCAKPNR